MASNELDAAGNPRRESYDEAAIAAMISGAMMGPGNAKLPGGAMQRITRITKAVELAKGTFVNEKKVCGLIEAEFDLDDEALAWLYDCHFEGDPLHPGSMGGFEPLLQLLGFAGCWFGLQGRGRAQGFGGGTFTAEVKPGDVKLHIQLHVTTVANRGARFIKGFGAVSVERADGSVEQSTVMEDMRVVFVD